MVLFHGVKIAGEKSLWLGEEAGPGDADPSALTPERSCPVPWTPGKDLPQRGDEDLGNSSHTWITMAEISPQLKASQEQGLWLRRG